MSGTFGELRPDHFHSGLDFSTQNKENLEVLASADGYVSRIKISSGGYGKVIYLTHPNGFVTVYAHLNAFNVVVDDYVKRKQYEQKSFEIELFPNPALFKIKKGDIIGYSGNSGASGGPHLHFEIRNTRTEIPINPLYSGIYPIGKEKIVIEKLALYPFGTNSLINGQNKKVILETSKTKRDTSLKVSDTIRVEGNIFFGMEAYQKTNADDSWGLYAEEIRIDSMPFFRISFDSVSFDDWRYVNTLKDYETYNSTNAKIIQTYIAPGNRLKIYSSPRNKGFYFFCDTNYHVVTFIAEDIFGNKASQKLIVKSATPLQKTVSTKTDFPLYHYGLKEHFEAKNITVDFPENALYDSIYFDYKVTDGNRKTYSVIHQVQDANTPIHSYVLVKIKPNIPFTDSIKPKLCMARFSNNTYSYVKSEWTDGYISAKIHTFGNYCIVADTTPPEIKPLGNLNHKKINPDELIRFTISDNFSGIDTYTLTLNGKWILADYDAKNDLLTYKADAANFVKGNNDLKLVVTDKLKNQQTISLTLVY